MRSVTQETRRASYEQVIGELGTRQSEVLHAVQSHPGITAWEIAAQIKRYVHAVRPRLTELRAKGLVEAQGTKWHQETLRTEAMWFMRDSTGQQELGI